LAVLKIKSGDWPTVVRPVINYKKFWGL